MTAAVTAAQAVADQRQHALRRLRAGVDDDMAACARLQQLQEAQFDAALRHQNGRLAELAGSVADLLDQMEARRCLRVALVSALAGPAASMGDMMPLLHGPARQALEQHWAELQQQVLDCKRRNERNGALLTEQYSIMQRVLLGEEQLYAPT